METNQSTREFHENGYVVLPNFYSEDQIKTLRQRVDDYMSTTSTDSSRLLYTESKNGKSQVCRVEYFALEDEFVRENILPPLNKLCNEIIGEPMLLFKDKVNYKLSGGAGFTPHQDGAAYIFDSSYVSVSIAIDPATIENGCLWIAPGEHKGGQLTHVQGQIDPEIVKKFNWIPVEMNPGDIMVFHNHLPHYSEKNSTDSPRRNMYLTFCTAKDGELRETYYKEKLEKFPPVYLRIPGKDYSEGALIYNLSNPID